MGNRMTVVRFTLCDTGTTNFKSDQTPDIILRGSWTAECPTTGGLVKVAGPTAEERARGSFSYYCRCGGSYEVELEART